jgi:hypothetical protein
LDWAGKNGWPGALPEETVQQKSGGKKKRQKNACSPTKLWYCGHCAALTRLFFDILRTARQGFPGACGRETAAGCWRRGSSMIEPALCKRHLEGH